LLTHRQTNKLWKKHNIIGEDKKKVKANTCYSISYCCSEVVHNLESGSWSVWANDTAAQ